MPTGIYKRNENNCIFFKKGKIPHNKGKKSERSLKRIDLVKKGLSVVCKIHGTHDQWRYHSKNNVQCKKCATEWQRKRKIKNPLKESLKDAREHAKKYKRNFQITEKDLVEIRNVQSNCCALTGVEFNENILPSIDRIDSSKGYEKDNIQLVLIKINRMKSNLDQLEFIDLCEKVFLKKPK